MRIGAQQIENIVDRHIGETVGQRLDAVQLADGHRNGFPMTGTAGALERCGTAIVFERRRRNVKCGSGR